MNAIFEVNGKWCADESLAGWIVELPYSIVTSEMQMLGTKYLVLFCAEARRS